MTRNNMFGWWRLHRRVFDSKMRLPLIHSSPLSNLSETLVSSSSSSSLPSFFYRTLFSVSLSGAANSQLSFLHSRPISSTSGPSNTVLIKSEEGFNTSLRKVKDESLPAIFYFTAVWCGPCRLISPVIGELSQKHPQVAVYKIDIDEQELGRTLSELNIMSVPTLHFFRNGKKAAEIIGADVARIKETVEQLYE